MPQPNAFTNILGICDREVSMVGDDRTPADDSKHVICNTGSVSDIVSDLGLAKRNCTNGLLRSLTRTPKTVNGLTRNPHRAS